MKFKVYFHYCVILALQVSIGAVSANATGKDISDSKDNFTGTSITQSFNKNIPFDPINSGGDVAALTSWVSGTTNTKVSGSNRLMTVLVMGESTGDFSATGVTYGGQTMTKETDRLYYVGGNRSYAAIFTLNESGVDAATSGTISVTWSSTPNSGSAIYSVLLSNVDQTTPVSVSAENALTGTSVSTSALSASSGDMVIMCGTTENNNTITFNNGFTQVFETNTSWGDGTGGYKMGSGVNETPSYDQDTDDRMVICSIVAKKIDGGSGPLPVELVSFEATNVDEGILLEWETATEVNNYGFQVERQKIKDESVTPSEVEVWEELGFVEGHGNSNSPKSYEFLDQDYDQDQDLRLKYRLKQIDTDGTYKYYDTIAEVNNSITNIDEETLPTEYGLSQNYPNPFNPTTTINYQLPEASEVNLKVYDILGNEIATLVDEKQAAGKYNITFNAGRLSSGIYLYKLVVGNYSAIKKLTLIK